MTPNLGRPDLIKQHSSQPILGAWKFLLAPLAAQKDARRRLPAEISRLPKIVCSQKNLFMDALKFRCH